MLTIPAKGRSKEGVLEAMRAARDHDIKWEQGRVFGLVYHISDEIDNLLKEAFTMFFAENGLNPTAFPSLRKFETEVVAMTAALLGGDPNVCGNITTGGTESLLMAVKTARDWARYTARKSTRRRWCCPSPRTQLSTRPPNTSACAPSTCRCAPTSAPTWRPCARPSRRTLF